MRGRYRFLGVICLAAGLLLALGAAQGGAATSGVTPDARSCDACAGAKNGVANAQQRVVDAQAELARRQALQAQHIAERDALQAQLADANVVLADAQAAEDAARAALDAADADVATAQSNLAAAKGAEDAAQAAFDAACPDTPGCAAATAALLAAQLALAQARAALDVALAARGIAAAQLEAARLDERNAAETVQHLERALLDANAEVFLDVTRVNGAQVTLQKDIEALGRAEDRLAKCLERHPPPPNCP